MAWTAATRGDYVRPSGSYASDVTDREWALIAPLLPAVAAGRATADDLPAAGGGRDLLPAAGRLPVADAAEGFPAAQHRLRLLPGVDRGRGLGARPRYALPPDPGTGGPRREPDRGDHRQPERENQRGSPRNGRIRRRKAGQGPQAAPGHRHPRPDAARGRFRQGVRHRRRGVVWSSTGSPAASPSSMHLRGRRLPRAARRRGRAVPLSRSSSAPTPTSSSSPNAGSSSAPSPGPASTAASPAMSSVPPRPSKHSSRSP